MGITRDGLKGVRVAVNGAGGAARAIVAGFAGHGATVVVYNRTLEKAQALAEQFNEAPGVNGAKGGKVVAARTEKLCDSCCQVFINCTPIGMHPNVDETPIPTAADTKGWGPGTVVFDTIYNPPMTRLLREARAAGCVTINGGEMFVRQAAAQFKLWTGKEAPMEVFRRVERTDPDTARRFLFMTAGAFSPQAQQFVEEHHEHTIDKPIRADVLRRLIGRRVAEIRSCEPSRP